MKRRKNDFEMIDIWQKNSLLPITTWHNSFEDVEIRNHHISQLLFVNCFMKKKYLKKKIMVDQEKKNFRVGVIVTEREDQKHYFRKSSRISLNAEQFYLCCNVIFDVKMHKIPHKPFCFCLHWLCLSVTTKYQLPMI